MSSENIVWHKTLVTREQREQLLGQKSKVLWFTGLSGSGKSTVATALEKKLNEIGKLTYLLDGDNVRHGLNKDLGFSLDARKENIRRIGELTKLFVDAGVIVIACFISPQIEERQSVRELLGEDFIEVYVNCPLEECEKRDPKGLYQKARAGIIKEFTGISSPYEAPLNAEVEINTVSEDISTNVDKIIKYLGY